MKTLMSIFIALFLSLSATIIQAEDTTPGLPDLDKGFHWQSMPMICASDVAVLNRLKEQGFVAVNMSLGKRGADPQGEALFMITYFINQEGTSTAAVMNIPSSNDACLIFLTHDVVFRPVE